MIPTDKKLAEEMIETFLFDEQFSFTMRYKIEKMMVAFHRAKLAEITDEDIEKCLEDKENAFSNGQRYSELYKLFFTEGAKAFRDGEIKHIEK